jgi:hypothetical protein
MIILTNNQNFLCNYQEKKTFDLFELEKIDDLDFFEIFEKLLTKNFFLDLYNHFPGASIAAATAVSPLARRVVNTPLSMAYRKFALEVKTAVVKDFSIFFFEFLLDLDFFQISM